MSYKAPWTTWFTTITDDVDAAFKVRFVDWDDSEIEIQTVAISLPNATATPALPLRYPYPSSSHYVG